MKIKIFNKNTFLIALWLSFISKSNLIKKSQKLITGDEIIEND